MGDKVIAYSLWGDNPRYTKGAIRNVELAENVYPEWKCWVHVGDDVSNETIDELMTHKNTEVYKMGPDGGLALGTLWRFLPASESNVDVMICRDVDSRLTMREKAVVDEWVDSEKGFHIIRDHPYHNVPICAGMWGIKKGVIPNMGQLIVDYVKKDFWMVDQYFLAEVIYPLIQNDVMVHDEVVILDGLVQENNLGNNTTKEEALPFKHMRDEKHFVGQAYDGDDKILDDDEYFRDSVLEPKAE